MLLLLVFWARAQEREATTITVRKPTNELPAVSGDIEGTWQYAGSSAPGSTERTPPKGGKEFLTFKPNNAVEHRIVAHPVGQAFYGVYALDRTYRKLEMHSMRKGRTGAETNDRSFTLVQLDNEWLVLQPSNAPQGRWLYFRRKIVITRDDR